MIYLKFHNVCLQVKEVEQEVLKVRAKYNITHGGICVKLMTLKKRFLGGNPVLISFTLFFLHCISWNFLNDDWRERERERERDCFKRFFFSVWERKREKGWWSLKKGMRERIELSEFEEIGLEMGGVVTEAVLALYTEK